jgi:hypothetical protein
MVRASELQIEKLELGRFAMDDGFFCVVNFRSGRWYEDQKSCLALVAFLTEI